jgi:hypothetical protein
MGGAEAKVTILESEQLMAELHVALYFETLKLYIYIF